jgi:transposase
VQCEATTRAGARCRARAKTGETLCAVHTGAARRPTKLTPDVRTRLVQVLQIGTFRENAARYVGIGVSTFYRWMEAGEADVEHDRQTPFRELWEAVTRAEAHAEVVAVGKIGLAARSDWRAAAFLLERRWPERWGRRRRVELTHVGYEEGERRAMVVSSEDPVPLDDDALSELADLVRRLGLGGRDLSEEPPPEENDAAPR